MTEQFGFRKGITTQEAIFIPISNILMVLNKLQQVGGIFCDLQEVFKCVNHKTALGKLNYYGKQGVNIKWFESHLTNRKQRTEVISEDHQHKFSSH